MTYKELISGLTPYDMGKVNAALQDELIKNKQKIIVLDDDPTGCQTVHDIDVYTDWSVQTFQNGFAASENMFFILTNSRAFHAAKTEAVHKEIAANILSQSSDFILVSRGDSTLRGHYPLETQVLRDALAESGVELDGEIIMPFFPEGGRYTVGDVHYVKYGEELVPAGETEFAKDKTFGYTNSDLKKWVEEKTKGTYPAKNVLSISLEQLRSLDYDGVTELLCRCNDFSKIIVNAVEYSDVKVFVTAYYRALSKGKRFLFRSAAGVVRILGGIPEKPPLTSEELCDANNANGGLIVVGSHVQKTTAQLQMLKSDPSILFVELNQHLVTDKEQFEQEARRVSELVNANIQSGKTVAVSTRRERFDIQTGNKEDELRLAVEIGDKLISVVSNLSVRPSFIIAKGGITSSDVATKGLGIRKARIAGQALPGIPVWKTGEESKFNNLMLVIFPGNVGDENALRDVVDKLRKVPNSASERNDNH